MFVEQCQVHREHRGFCTTPSPVPCVRICSPHQPGLFNKAPLNTSPLPQAPLMTFASQSSFCKAGALNALGRTDVAVPRIGRPRPSSRSTTDSPAYPEKSGHQEWGKEGRKPHDPWRLSGCKLLMKIPNLPYPGGLTVLCVPIEKAPPLPTPCLQILPGDTSSGEEEKGPSQPVLFWGRRQ